MHLAVKIILCLIVGYLFGNISTGYIVGKINHMDIREHGSGNAGTTNAFRTMGNKAGVFTFIGDFLKACIPLFIMKYFIFDGDEYLKILMLVFGFGVVLGHNYPFWLKFKGGKGIAATGGVFFAFDPLILIPGVIVFVGVIYISKYVSLGSMVLSVMFPIWIAVRCYGESCYIWLILIGCCYTISAFIRHHENIKRLMNGTENKVGHHEAS